MAQSVALRRGDVVSTPLGRAAIVLGFSADRSRVRAQYVDDDEQADLAATLIRFKYRPCRDPLAVTQRESVLQAVREAPSTAEEIGLVTGIPERHVRAYLSVLIAGGKVKRISLIRSRREGLRGPGSRILYGAI